MGERTEYAPGTFSWTDLSTTDQEAAKAFYGELFGWKADDMPADDQGTMYSMMNRGGQTVAAISPQQQAARDAGAPPIWNSYVTVASVDDVAARAAELGATIAMPPFDVLDAGRMTGIVDPQGAFLLMWQPNRHIGAALVNAPGALVWNELVSNDVDGSISFYGDLFDWRISSSEQSPMPYWGIENAGRRNGGIREAAPAGTPPHWLVYFGVDDLEAAMAKVIELGGTVHVGPIDIRIAQIAVASDPQGAVFALYDGQLDG